MRYVSQTLPLLVALALTACNSPAPQDSAYTNRGAPETLLDQSSERVALPLAASGKLADQIAKDQPSQAELSCASDGKACLEAKKILELSAVPYREVEGHEGTITLIYDRIVARDCDARYVDNVRNYHNTNHPSFGCALSANMLRQIADKQEIVAPARTDPASAVRAVNDIKRAYTPREIVKPYKIKESLTQGN